jgi:uncharacterized LabA/DUF88 family protein
VDVPAELGDDLHVEGEGRSMQRVMLFVDGSNVVGVLRRMNLKVEDYEAFYRFVYEQAVKAWQVCLLGPPPTSTMMRVLWYAVGSLDEWDLSDPKVQATLHESFEKDREQKRTYMALAGQKLQGASQAAVAKEAWSLCFNEAKDWYEKRCDLVSGFRRFYHWVRSTTDFIDIIECGHWRTDLLARTVDEKGLDTRLAVDMVTLDGSYDFAVLVSGDADNIPSLDYAKRRGKHVAVVEFLAGYPPEKKSAHASSRLKVAADLVVQIYEMEIVKENLAKKGDALSAPSL